MQQSKQRINYAEGRGQSKVRKPMKVRIARRAVLVVLVAAALLALGSYIYQKREPVIAALEEFVATTVDAKVEHILVEGVTYANPQDLLLSIGMARGDSLVGFDAAAARARVEETEWVKLATVSRQLPDTIKVDVIEHKPAARLIEGDEAWVITKDGFKIAEVDNRFDHLPVLAGDGVGEEAANLFALLSPYQELAQNLIKATLVGERRWDVQFTSGVTVQLPEENPARALLLLLRLQQERDVLNMKGGSVDLRLDDRIIIRQPEEARGAVAGKGRHA